jgi:hypothetical protein
MRKVGKGSSLTLKPALHQDEIHPSRELVRADDGGREMKARSASAIYRKAAEMVAGSEDDASCLAIEEVCGRRAQTGWATHTTEYREFFSPSDEAKHGVWGRRWADDGYEYGDPTVRECRVLALLLMSEIAKDEQ